MAWNVLVVLLMVVLTLVIVREGLRRALVHELDERLHEDTLEVGLAIQRFYPRLQPVYEELERKAQGHAHTGWFAQLYDLQGQVLWTSAEAPAFDPPDPVARKPFRQSVGSHRLALARLERPGVPVMLIRVGSSLEPLNEDVALLTRMMVLAGGVILLVVPLGGYWLAGRATRPLARIIQTTAGLRPSNLEERLPLRGTGDELDQLSRTINGLLDRIAAYLDQKRDFIANAAHELRSPLAAIRSSVEVALNSDRTTDEYVTLLADIMEECAGLGALVNQLLLLAESDAGRLALHEQSARLDQVVEKSVDMFRGVAESEGVELLLSRADPVCVSGDEYHLRQVIQNLLDNAIKFTPPGGRVEIGVEADPSRRTARLCVADTGAGISAEELPRVFERFYQGDKSRRREGRRRGNGLGLSICQSIVTALQGTIEVASTPGVGSRFTVRLPATSPAPVVVG